LEPILTSSDSFLSFCTISTSTLFPYTTLFRSAVLEDVADLRPRIAVHRGEPDGGKEVRDRHPDLGVSVDHVLLRLPDVGSSPEEDRKSTRLNSSHQIISYAVFCLKKKKSAYTQ